MVWDLWKTIAGEMKNIVQNSEDDEVSEKCFLLIQRKILESYEEPHVNARRGWFLMKLEQNHRERKLRWTDTSIKYKERWMR